MTPSVRRLALLIHIIASVGWAGAVGAFLVLAVVAVQSSDASTGTAMYIAMQAIAWYLILPCTIASLVSGVLQSLGTAWGLFRDAAE